MKRAALPFLRSLAVFIPVLLLGTDAIRDVAGASGRQLIESRKPGFARALANARAALERERVTRATATTAQSARKSDVVLALRDVRICSLIDGQEIVHGVTFSLARGRVVGIVGESGSGKTLTCRALLGILPKTLAFSGGSIELEGRDIAGFRRKDWNVVRGSVIAAVFQDPASYLNPAIRVGRQIAELFQVQKKLPRRAARASVLQLFTTLQLRDPELVFEQYPHELSGGMLQRVLIASAIALDPRILIADEATTALDVTVQAEILDLLLDLKERTGLSLVVVSHDLALVGRVCDEVLVMRSGHVVEQGPAAEILYRPKHEYTRLLVAEHGVHGLAPNSERPRVAQPEAAQELDHAS